MGTGNRRTRYGYVGKYSSRILPNVWNENKRIKQIRGRSTLSRVALPCKHVKKIGECLMLKVDFHTHIIAEAFLDLANKYGEDRWPVLGKTCNCGANIMIK